MMQNKKKAILGIIAILYVSIVSFLVPYMLIVLDLNHLVYDMHEEMASLGVFFFFFIIGTFIFFPFIYTTLEKKKLSLMSFRSTRKKAKNQRYYGFILFIIGIPIIIWLIIGMVRYFSISEFTGGLGVLVSNGFLVMIIMIMYFFIIPGFILSLQRSKKSV